MASRTVKTLNRKENQVHTAGYECLLPDGRKYFGRVPITQEMLKEITANPESGSFVKHLVKQLLLQSGCTEEAIEKAFTKGIRTGFRDSF